MKLLVPKLKNRRGDESLIRQRIARTIRMLGLLKSGPIYNTQRLADEFSVSRRTVYRDLRTLRDAGVPIFVDKRSEAYYVRSQREPGQMPLVYDQVALLALAAHLSPLNCNREYATKIRSAISTLIDGLPGSMHIDVGRLMSSMQGESIPLPTQVIDKIIHALRSQRRIQVLTETERGVYANLEILPHDLVIGADGWQLVGQIRDDGSLRAFNVGSFLRVELDDRPRDLPGTVGRGISETRATRRKSLQKALAMTRKVKLPKFACAG